MDFDVSRQIAALPSGRDPIPGYRFAPPDEFGSPLGDLREIDSADESFLAVSEDGQLGIHGPETFGDSRAIYQIKPGRGFDAT